jgi:hypothetical protein
MPPHSLALASNPVFFGVSGIASLLLLLLVRLENEQVWDGRAAACVSEGVAFLVVDPDDVGLVGLQCDGKNARPLVSKILDAILVADFRERVG